MEDMKKKLMQLIGTLPCTSDCADEPGSCPDRKYGNCGQIYKLDHCAVLHLTNHLIAAGAVIPVRCVECQRWVPDDSRKDFGICYRTGHKGGIWKPANGYCDQGVRKTTNEVKGNGSPR